FCSLLKGHENDSNSLQCILMELTRKSLGDFDKTLTNKILVLIALSAYALAENPDLLSYSKMPNKRNCLERTIFHYHEISRKLNCSETITDREYSADFFESLPSSVKEHFEAVPSYYDFTDAKQPEKEAFYKKQFDRAKSKGMPESVVRYVYIDKPAVDTLSTSVIKHITDINKSVSKLKSTQEFMSNENKPEVIEPLVKSVFSDLKAFDQTVLSILKKTPIVLGADSKPDEASEQTYFTCTDKDALRHFAIALLSPISYGVAKEGDSETVYSDQEDTLLERINDIIDKVVHFFRYNKLPLSPEKTAWLKEENFGVKARLNCLFGLASVALSENLDVIFTAGYPKDAFVFNLQRLILAFGHNYASYQRIRQIESTRKVIFETRGYEEEKAAYLPPKVISEDLERAGNVFLALYGDMEDIDFVQPPADVLLAAYFERAAAAVAGRQPLRRSDHNAQPKVSSFRALLREQIVALPMIGSAYVRMFPAKSMPSLPSSMLLKVFDTLLLMMSALLLGVFVMPYLLIRAKIMQNKQHAGAGEHDAKKSSSIIPQSATPVTHSTPASTVVNSALRDTHRPGAPNSAPSTSRIIYKPGE
ncbi:MAG: hypothetical protein V4490_06255, partial [Pseudomonadota bacterium]